MKSIKLPLLAKVLIAIALGIATSYFMPMFLTRIFETINAIFSSYLGFVIPFIIVGLVAPSIQELGSRAGKMVLITAFIAYASTIFAGYLSFFTATATYPTILSGASFQSVDIDSAVAVAPLFKIDMPPLFGVTSALILAFVVGLTTASFKREGSVMVKFLNEFREIVMSLINRSIIPMLPIYIYGIFLKLGVEGQVAPIISLFIKVIGIIFVLHIGLLLLQFCIAGAVSRKNPLKSLLGMMPAYFTALGTQSSAATIPVTLGCAKKLGVSDDVAEFTVPLCATIHLSGSMLKIVACAMAIAFMTDMPLGIDLYSGFIFMLAITMVAAPGVPGGAIMAALALLGSQLGFDEVQSGLMIALYIAMDSFGTACNVTGDGAISMIVNSISKRGK
ncbi:MAG: dicarboxylate/amino acid:cation symporter [Rikenellaceae bacterium]